MSIIRLPFIVFLYKCFLSHPRILSDVFGLAHTEVFNILKDVGYYTIDDVTRSDIHQCL